MKKIWRNFLWWLLKNSMREYGIIQMIPSYEIKRHKEDIIEIYKKQMAREIAMKILEEQRFNIKLEPVEHLSSVKVRMTLRIL